MSYFLIPITNLIIKQNLVFKDTIIIPIYQTKQVEECKEIYPEIYSIITTNQTFYNHSCESLLNIAFVKTSIQHPCDSDFELAINIVNRALDYMHNKSCSTLLLHLDYYHKVYQIPFHHCNQFSNDNIGNN